MLEHSLHCIQCVHHLFLFIVLFTVSYSTVLTFCFVYMETTTGSLHVRDSVDNDTERKEKRREYMKKYIASRRDNESQQQRSNRLFKKNRSKKIKLQAETEEEKQRRLYNRRLSYHGNLSAMTKEELKKSRAKEQQRKAIKRCNATDSEKQKERLKNYVRIITHQGRYEQEAYLRQQKKSTFHQAI